MNLRWWRHPGPASLMAYRDGQGSLRQRARVASHLQRCETCAALLVLIGNALSDETEPLRMPDALAARVRGAIVREPAVGRQPWTAAARLACATGLLLVVLVGSRAGHAEFRDTSGRPLRAIEAAAADAHGAWSGGGATSITRAAVIERAHQDTEMKLRFVDHADGLLRTRWIASDTVRVGRTTASLVHAELNGEPVTLVTAYAAAIEGPAPWSWTAKPMDVRRGADGTRMFTWTNGGQAYALVSNERLGAGACLLCHREVP